MNKKDIEDISLIISEAKKLNIPQFDWWLRQLSSVNEKIAESADYYIAYQEMENFMDEEFENILTKKFGGRWSTKRSLTEEDTRKALAEAEDTARRKCFPEEYE